MTAQARLLGGRYQVGELLGYGGMAEVHKGRDLRLGRDVAIKLLRTDLARDATFQERFRREAQNAAALNHPAIVAVYDTGEEISSTGEKLPFIVMEFVNGQTLKEVLAAEQRIQPRRALEMIADICAALEFSHRHGIIHRDIKPGNVMLTQNGQVKVMDFGIARALASGATTMTQTSAVIGTAQYLSPEQARGEAVDARSDVYAAGCVLFELLIGHPPFVGDSPVSVAYQHVREDPRTPSDVNPEVPPDVDAIVLKALAKNPLNRYQSAQEMRADALRAVSGRPVLATPVMGEAETMAMAGTAQRPVNGTRPIPAAMAPGRQPERTSSWVMAVLAALGVLAAIALVVGIYMLKYSGNQAKTPTTVAMPNLVGKSQSDAQKLLDQAGLAQIRPGSPQTDDECDVGKVTKQDPEPNQQVELTQTGSFTMCTGPGKVTIPPGLIGSPVDNVEKSLKSLGLRVDRENKDSAEDEGKVLGLDPGEGKSVDKNSRVVITVSRGNLNEVPNVVGDPVESAKAELQQAGFEVKIVAGRQVLANDQSEVESQSPKAGSVQRRGSTITLRVTVPADPPEEPSTPPSSPTDDNPSDPASPGVGGGGGEDDDGGIIGGIIGKQRG